MEQQDLARIARRRASAKFGFLVHLIQANRGPGAR